MSIPYADNLKASKFAVRLTLRWCWPVSKKHHWVRCVNLGASCRCRFWFTAAATWRWLKIMGDATRGEEAIALALKSRVIVMSGYGWVITVVHCATRVDALIAGREQTATR